MVWIGERRFSAAMAVIVMMVEQLGFEMMPWCFCASPGLISGTTSGTLSSMRNTKTAPAFTMAGANRLARGFWAAPSTMSMPSKA